MTAHAENYFEDGAQWNVQRTYDHAPDAVDNAVNSIEESEQRLGGRRVVRPGLPGVYIRVCGSETRKVVVK